MDLSFRSFDLAETTIETKVNRLMIDIKGRHLEQVIRWAAQATTGLSRKQKMSLFEAAISDLWECARGTISEIALMAVFDRVIFSISNKFPAVSRLRVQPYGVEFSDFNKITHSLTEEEITNSLAAIISEFLSVLEKLTAEVITPFLYLKLLRVTLKTRFKNTISPNGGKWKDYEKGGFDKVRSKENRVRHSKP